MAVVLYWMAISHPSAAARKVLDLKGIDYDVVKIAPMNQRLHMRLAGFRHGTVPGLKLDGRKIQGTRAIARALDERWPEPPLYPTDPELRRRVEEAERWGDEQLQPIPRRIFRFGAANDAGLRRWIARRQHLPAPDLVAALMQPAVAYYARTVESDGRRGDEAGVRADLAALPAMLDHIDDSLADGTLTLDPPNAATVQILVSVRLLDGFEDLHDLVAMHACAEPAREMFSSYKASLPRFLDPAWLEPIDRAMAR